MTSAKEIMSYEDAADLLGYSRRRIQQLVATGELEEGSIRSTVTVVSVRVRQKLIGEGFIRRGPKAKPKTDSSSQTTSGDKSPKKGKL